MNENNKMIAACGLVCTGCDMMKATTNPELAKRIAVWFKKELKMDVKPEDISCAGCKEDRAKNWSADCWILKCCIDDKGLQFCSECSDFPCEKLVEWSKENEEGYGKAFERLKEMKAASQ